MTWSHATLLPLIALATFPTVARGQAPAEPSAALPTQVILVLPAVEAPARPCEAAEAPAEEAELLTEPAAFAPAPLRLGLSGLVGLRDDGSRGVAPTWTAGLDVGLRLTPREDRWLFVDLSLRRITVGGAETLAGERWAIGASPAVSVGGRVAERVEVYAELGAGMQSRFGGQGTAVGIAPFGGGGVRFYVADFFSIAVEGALHVPATHGFLFGNEVFPQAAAVFQGGLALAFHLG
jgi:hypothetical protein